MAETPAPVPTNNLALEIIGGLVRCIAIVIGAAMVVYAYFKLNRDPTLIGLGTTLITFATGGSVLQKVVGDKKFQTALATEPPKEPTQ
jgi:hypothetical protein